MSDGLLSQQNMKRKKRRLGFAVCSQPAYFIDGSVLFQFQLDHSLEVFAVFQLVFQFRYEPQRVVQFLLEYGVVPRQLLNVVLC